MKTYKISDYLEEIKDVEFKGDPERNISNVLPLSEIINGNNESSDSLSWMGDAYIKDVSGDIQVGLLITTKGGYEKLKDSSINFLISENPRRVFQNILSKFYRLDYSSKTEPSAIVHSTAKIGSNVYIGHNVVIEEDCIIGDDSVILHNTVIYRKTIIGNKVVIGSNCTIGNYGFGYEKDESGNFQRLEHLGNVVIQDEVEIHNNTCIDRAVLGSTLLEQNSKIDNLVHIAHSAVIKENALVIANAVVAGSTIVGKNSWIGPTVTLKDKITIAENTLVGIGSVVVKNTEPNTVLVGNPAYKMDDFKKILKHQKELINNQDK